MIEIFIKSNVLIFAIFSTGFLFNKYLLNFKTNNSYSEISLLGVIILSIISFLLHFFVPLNILVSNFIFIFPLALILKEKFFSKDILKIIKFCLILSVLIVLYLSYSNFYRPDAGWYHIPFSRLISDYKIIIGTASLHPMFGTTSIIQYLSSAFHNSLTGANGVLFANPIILIIFLAFFFENFLKGKQPILKFFSLIVLFTIFIEMNRNSELGNDALGYLYYFYLFYIFLRSIIENKYKENRFKFLSLISVFCFLIKSVYVFAFIFPFYFFIQEKLYKNINNYFNIASLILIAWLLRNIILTGCLIYPMNITCSENLSWYSSNSKFEISAKNTSQFSELHSKGWPDFEDSKQYYLNYEDQIEKKKLFLKRFNWLEDYLNQGRIYNITKKINFLLPVIIVFLLINYCFSKKSRQFFYKKRSLLKKINYKFLSFTSITFTFIILFKLPDARYFFSYLVVSIFLLIIYFFNAENIFSKKKKLKNLSNIFLIILFSIFVIKNTFKIINKSENQTVFPSLHYKDRSYEFVTKKISSGNIFKIYYTDDKYSKFASKKLCVYHKSPCIQNKSITNQFEVKQINGYLVLKLNKY